MNIGRRYLVWAALYAMCMAALIAGVFQARRYALRDYATSDVQRDWEAWRVEAKRMGTAEGPVQFKDTPRSPAPPLLVLMQDYFVACLLFAVMLSTVLFGTLMFMVRGVLRSSRDESGLEVSNP